MIALYNGETHDCILKVYKGQSQALEDYTRSVPFLFIVGKDKIPVSCTAANNEVKFTLPEGIKPGAYDVELIWCKNVADATKPLHFRQYNSAVWSYAEVQDAFTMTEYQDEATAYAGGQKLVISTHVATYGHNGLSAYDIAVMEGKTTLSQNEWLSNLSELSAFLNNYLNGHVDMKMVDMEIKDDGHLYGEIDFDFSNANA